MKPNFKITKRQRKGFTLIELLIVIAIMAILAALVFPVMGTIKKSTTLSKAKAELKQVELAIEAYKLKLNHYPPDVPPPVPTRLEINPLYFELVGTTNNGTGFVTSEGSASIYTASIPAFFGAGVQGFANCTRGGGDDLVKAENFLKSGLKVGQYGETKLSPNETVRLLACSIGWPTTEAIQPVPAIPGLNPWRYNSSNPTNNPGNYDLWVDVRIGGKTYRVSNWSGQPQVVSP